MLSPPQKWSKTVLLMIRSTGNLNLSASFTQPVATEEIHGWLTRPKMKLAFFIAASDLYWNATSVSSNETLGLVSIATDGVNITWIFIASIDSGRRRGNVYSVFNNFRIKDSQNPNAPR